MKKTFHRKKKGPSSFFTPSPDEAAFPEPASLFSRLMRTFFRTRRDRTRSMTEIPETDTIRTELSPDAASDPLPPAVQPSAPPDGISRAGTPSDADGFPHFAEGGNGETPENDRELPPPERFPGRNRKTEKASIPRFFSFHHGETYPRDPENAGYEAPSVGDELQQSGFSGGGPGSAPFSEKIFHELLSEVSSGRMLLDRVSSEIMEIRKEMTT